jgi:fatty-acyl-CoA synthase
MIAAPTFHAWGLAHLLLGSTLSSTLVMRRKFDPEGTLAAIAESRAHNLAVVPVMIQRILGLDPAIIKKYDTSSLRVVAASGSALPGELALRWMDTFGDNLHNFYGSTEVAQTSIATPKDLRAAPGTAGRPPRGTVVKIFDNDGNEVPAGVTGRIFVGNKGQFEGDTGGGTKEMKDGLMSIGDVGHFDEQGRLYVEGAMTHDYPARERLPDRGREPAADHAAVADVAVTGVADERGQREGLRRTQAGRAAHRGGSEELRQGTPGALQGAARGGFHRRGSAQRHRQGAQARSEGLVVGPR